MRKEEAKIGLRPTLFEVETALSFLYFKEEKVDYALVEVGMGGRLDATHVEAALNEQFGGSDKTSDKPWWLQ